MNIFALSADPREAAALMHNRHIPKMTLETAQLLSTALSFRREWCAFLTPAEKWALYKPTHVFHPCAIWARETFTNYQWLVQHGFALAEEFERRFSGAEHKSKAVIDVCGRADSGVTEDVALTPFTQAMPDEYRVSGNAVRAYRQYYNGVKLPLFEPCGFMPLSTEV